MRTIRDRLARLLDSGTTFSIHLVVSTGTDGDWNLVAVHEDALEVVALGQSSGQGVSTLIALQHIVACVIEID